MDGSKRVDVDPIYTVPLVTMVGVSSSFVAQGLVPQSDVAQDLAGSEELSYWNNVRARWLVGCFFVGWPALLVGWLVG